MKVIKRTHNQQEAKIIVGFLQANGVDAELLDGAINSMLPMPGGVRIAVPDDQEPKAVALLRDAENGETGLSKDPQ